MMMNEVQYILLEIGRRRRLDNRRHPVCWTSTPHQPAALRQYESVFIITLLSVYNLRQHSHGLTQRQHTNCMHLIMLRKLHIDISVCTRVCIKKITSSLSITITTTPQRHMLDTINQTKNVSHSNITNSSLIAAT